MSDIAARTNREKEIEKTAKKRTKDRLVKDAEASRTATIVGFGGGRLGMALLFAAVPSLQQFRTPIQAAVAGAGLYTAYTGKGSNTQGGGLGVGLAASTELIDMAGDRLADMLPGAA